jgi:alkylhydroperoxidase/carboxymuconolactone decarboxylase family protein YurZ
MIKALMSLLTGQRSWIPLAVMTALLLAACAWIHVQGLRLDATRADAARQVQAAQAAHDATRWELTQARADIIRLQATLDAARNSTDAVQDSLRDALAREAEAISTAVARKQILDQMRTRTRTEPETLEVVDDATRAAVAARLNRPL